MSSIKSSGWCTSQCRLNSQVYDTKCIGCFLPLHLICAAVITKDKGLCYDCKNIRRLEIDLFGKLVHPIQPPTTSHFQQTTTAIIQSPVNSPCRYKTPITPLTPDRTYLPYPNPSINQLSKKQRIQIINKNNYSNSITLDRTNNINLAIDNLLSVNQTHVTQLLPEDVSSPITMTSQTQISHTPKKKRMQSDQASHQSSFALPDNSTVINLFPDSNNNITQTSSLSNKNIVQTLPNIQYSAPTSISQQLNLNVHLYFNPTPFGNYCDMCKSAVGNNKRSIIRHMKDKHGIIITHEQSVSLVKYIEEKITIASSSPNFCIKNIKVNDGYECECGACFSELKILHNHLRRNKNCNKYNKQSIIITKCGRTITHHQYQEVARKSLPSAVDTSKVITIISTLVPQHETVPQHAQWLYPFYLVKGDNFLDLIKQLIPLWSVKPSDDEHDLKYVLDQAAIWIKQSRSHVGFLRGDHRALLQMLGAIEKNEIVYYRTFNVRHNLSVVQNELFKFLQFIVRIVENEGIVSGLVQQNIIKDLRQIIQHSKLLQVDHHPLLIPQLLKTCLNEVVSNDLSHSFVSIYNIIRMFRTKVKADSNNKEKELIMTSCGQSASNIGTVQSFLRTSVCSYALLNKLSAKETEELMKETSSSTVLNQTSPMIRQCRDMQNKKPSVLRSTISPDGDIFIASFEFSKELYSQMIPNIVFVLDDLFQNIFIDDTFTIFTSTYNKLHVTRNTDDTFEAITSVDGKDYKLSELKLRSDLSTYNSVSASSSSQHMKYKLLCESSLSNSDEQDMSIDTNQLGLHTEISTCENLDTDIKLSIHKLVGYNELTLHGIGGGGIRFAELEDATLLHSQWHANTLYYEGDCKKTFTHRTEGKTKLHEHKLPPELGRRFLLFHIIIQTLYPSNKKLIPRLQGKGFYSVC